MDSILITGAGSGIGKAVAERLLAANKNVFLHSRTKAKLESSFSGVPALASDLTHPSAAEDLIAAAVGSFGKIDCVVHAAGVGLIRPALETSDAEFSRILNTNTRATFLLAKSASAHFAQNGGGLFLTFPGILGKSVMKNASAYIASKFAVTGLLKSMGLELQRAGVKFSLCYFGGVDTPFWDSLDMKVQRDKMIPVDTAADIVVRTLELPPHLVMGEMVLQPESHQL